LTRDDRSSSFRIATFNVENLGEGEKGHLDLAERVLLLRPQIVRLRADILCLQEVDSQRQPSSGIRSLSALDRLIADTEYQGFHRATTVSRTSGQTRDKHNLVILSRLPIARSAQIHHDLVAPPTYRPIMAEPGGQDAFPIEWDRPTLYVAIQLSDDFCLHLLNVHLRAPRAAFVPGQKADAHTWKSMAGWAEGFFLAAVKRAGQALETRLFIDTLFDRDPSALVAVCGDFNADVYDTPVRTVRGDEEDAGNPHLSMRTLVPVDRTMAESRRYSVVHHGRPQMLDHVLVSRPLLAWYRTVEIHNETLGDELLIPQLVRGSPESFHAPVVAEFCLTSVLGL
jgi:endonuclease/exonuclease/phosphatase family metal-dependent hydrolase